MLVATLVFVGCSDEQSKSKLSPKPQQQAVVQDENVFVGKFNATKDVYLITDSIEGKADSFKCNVYVVDKASTLVWRYEFYTINGEHYYTVIMNTGYRHSDTVFSGQQSSQVAANIYRYIKKQR